MIEVDDTFAFLSRSTQNILASFMMKNDWTTFTISRDMMSEIGSIVLSKRKYEKNMTTP